MLSGQRWAYLAGKGGKGGSDNLPLDLKHYPFLVVLSPSALEGSLWGVVDIDKNGIPLPSEMFLWRL